MLFLLLFLTPCLFAAQTGYSPIDEEILKISYQYKEILALSQSEKNNLLLEFSQKALEFEPNLNFIPVPLFAPLYKQYRLQIAQCLLAGAQLDFDKDSYIPQPRLTKNGELVLFHTSNIRPVLRGALLEAVRRGDLPLLEIYFQNGVDCKKAQLHSEDNMWRYCSDSTVADFLVSKQVLLEDKDCNISALESAINRNDCDLDYIRHLLLLNTDPVFHKTLHLATVTQHDSIKNGTKGDLLKMLVNRGANPHAPVPSSKNNKPSLIAALEDSPKEDHRKYARKMRVWYQETMRKEVKEYKEMRKKNEKIKN